MGKRRGQGPEMARFHRYAPGRDDRDFPAEEIDLSLGTGGPVLERIVQDDVVAELDAHGSEVARLHRHVPSPEDPDFEGEETEFSLRSDGYVLVRRVLRWRDGDPDRDSWRLHSRIRAATTGERGERVSEVFPKVIRHLTRKGFTMREGPASFEILQDLRNVWHLLGQIASQGAHSPGSRRLTYLEIQPSDAHDNRLTAAEIASLPIDAELVTLAACDTAYAEALLSDERLDLTRAYLVAGAAAVLATRWKVPAASWWTSTAPTGKAVPTAGVCARTRP